jgi:hypothetical protein
MVPDTSELTTLLENSELKVLTLDGDPVCKIDAEKTSAYVDDPDLTVGFEYELTCIFGSEEYEKSQD